MSSRQNPVSLVVALDGSGRASGNLFADDGDSLTGATHGLLLNFTANQVYIIMMVNMSALYYMQLV